MTVKVCKNHYSKPANKECSKCHEGLCKWCNYADNSLKLCEDCKRESRDTYYTIGVGKEVIKNGT